jgi:hypothetical protein
MSHAESYAYSDTIRPSILTSPSGSAPARNRNQRRAVEQFPLMDGCHNLTKISDNKQPVKRISANVVRSAAIKRNNLASRSPFAPPSFPPAIEEALKRHNIPTIAQDETISGTFGWASRDFIATAYAEGIVFMGYAYLASLSQRPEYRVVTEVIASEMTRECAEIHP